MKTAASQIEKYRIGDRKHMNKKLILSLVLGLGIVLTGCSEKKDTTSNEKEVTLHIVVEDKINGKELVNEEITQSGKIDTLYDFLEKCDDLDIVFKDGSYGTYIDEMKGLKQDFDKGPWWLYESETNETCKESGMCPAVKDLKIKDGDSFLFEYKKDF